jgi:hypothetical protein
MGLGLRGQRMRARQSRVAQLVDSAGAFATVQILNLILSVPVESVYNWRLRQKNPHTGASRVHVQ